MKMNKKLNQLNFSLFQWILISIRSLCLISALGANIFVHRFLNLTSSLFPFLIWKRYISCILNLILNRISLLILGFFKFDCQNFGYFSRHSQKVTLRSGFIGIGNHNNIIDFFYYSYLFNPIFVKIILSVQQDTEGKQFIKQVLYAPLNYVQALECALENKGFDPIIVRNQKQWKKFKYRKMNMKTLVSESFQQLKGCIFILLPGLKMNEHIEIQQKVTADIYQNQEKFLRSGVGFKVTFEDRPIYSKKYKNQIYFLLSLMSQLKVNRLDIKALTFRNFKYQYRKQTYKNFIQQNLYLTDKNIKYKKISYIDYINELYKQQQIEKGQGLEQVEKKMK